ncbi:hypothetical protein [Bradyrhizobium sp. Ce-3]|uniref:hypothetical protein n=1 Tax=Bradyrhizobium sp. Ce-3 TaxID=2913970 RepID=UPI001FC80EE2|nr:hypothetical protein [Bradyrhizobium sp. Ce-3]GKQ53127.1 hypothetical protein BRSPCE3_39820 [Bradyrhizobium sp. Ce-3]
MTSISAFGPVTASMTTGTLKKPLTADANSSTQASGGSALDDTVEQKFLKYAQMSPMDRMRANILKGMGLSEEDLKTMTPDQRAKVEQKIKELIEQSFQKNAGKVGQAVDISA